MLLKKVTLISFLLLVIASMSPSYATVATPSTVKSKSEVAKNQKKKKKMSFKDKIKLIKEFRKAKKEAKKASPNATSSVMQNSMFITGLILLGGGLVLGLLSIPIAGWIGGILAVVGVIFMIIALVREYA